ncbi:MAG: nucleotidyl transferase AbiEii/AbiGii toxin family protein [Minisyncoccia bacterium]|jgi:hypothetical protein
MHKEILTAEQVELLPLIAGFSKNFGLVGGTAVALHLGHRRSIDFDLFSKEKFGNQSLLNKILQREKPDTIIVNKLGELTLIVKGVKLTFFHYPYEIVHSQSIPGVIRMPDLLTLAAMKAFALGMRSKWKDYVDLYFIITSHHPVAEISRTAKKIFGGEFNEKLFRSQLSYFADIDYREAVEFLPGFEVDDATIKKTLVGYSLEQARAATRHRARPL